MEYFQLDLSKNLSAHVFTEKRWYKFSAHLSLKTIQNLSRICAKNEVFRPNVAKRMQ